MKQLIKKLLKKELTEQYESLIIEGNAIQSNSKEEISRLRMLPPEAEDGATLNLDGTKYTGSGLVVPVVSMNVPQKKLTTKTYLDFIKNNANKISTTGNFKFGLYKFPNSDLVSIDLNIVVDEANKDVALEFGKRAGQESLFNLGTFTNEKTGANGMNPVKFTARQFREIATSLNKGRLPRAVQAIA